MQVTKMHGLGNNYIYISEYDVQLQEDELAPLAIAVSDVRKGIGSDGLITIAPSEVAGVRMRIFNADGSEAETCGNGLRCVAKYAYEHGYVKDREFSVETKAGVVKAWVHVSESGLVERATIDMGIPQFGASAVGYVGPASKEQEQANVTLDVEGSAQIGMLVSMGNPHFVQFVENVETVDVTGIGPAIETHTHFPRRINVEFVAPIARNELDFRVWERGSGVTYACGTGACASVAAGIAAGKLDEKVVVHLLGGDLEIEQVNGRILMTGEAITVMTGEFVWPR